MPYCFPELKSWTKFNRLIFKVIWIARSVFCFPFPPWKKEKKKKLQVFAFPRRRSESQQSCSSTSAEVRTFDFLLGLAKRCVEEKYLAPWEDLNPELSHVCFTRLRAVLHNSRIHQLTFRPSRPSGNRLRMRCARRTPEALGWIVVCICLIKMDISLKWD